MLHELLLALSGHPGNIFIPYPPPPANPSTFAIPSDFPLLHPSERLALDRLARLGWIYHEIELFIREVQYGVDDDHDDDEGPVWEDDEFGDTSVVMGTIGLVKGSIPNKIKPSDQNSKPMRPRGAYIKALATAIHVYLSGYRTTIVTAEEKILNKHSEVGDNVVPLSHIASIFAPFELTLPPLQSLTREIIADPEKHHGCRLFNLLNERAQTGVWEVRECMENLLGSSGIQAVLIKQMTSWMVYGALVDPYREFFVRRVRKNDITAKDDEAKKDTADEAGKGWGADEANWKTQYVLDQSMIPATIPLSTAQSILFVGKAIATVRQNMTHTFSSRSHISNTLSGPVSMHPSTLPVELTRSHLTALHSLLHPSSSGNKGHGITATHPTTQAHLQRTILALRKNTAEWLFRRVLTEPAHNILETLIAFKNYFLLGRGDFAQNLIEGFSGLRTSKIAAGRSVTGRRNVGIGEVLSIREQELAAVWVRASVGTLTETEEGSAIWERFRLRLVEDPVATPSTATSTTPTITTTAHLFDDLLLPGIQVSLTYTLEWPLDLFLTSTDVAKYSHLFSFLIGLKRVQIGLAHLWGVLRDGWIGGVTGRKATNRVKSKQKEKDKIVVEPMEIVKEKNVKKPIEMNVKKPIEMPKGKVIEKLKEAPKVKGNEKGKEKLPPPAKPNSKGDLKTFLKQKREELKTKGKESVAMEEENERKPERERERQKEREKEREMEREREREIEIEKEKEKKDKVEYTEEYEEGNRSMFWENEDQKIREKIVWRIRGKMMFWIETIWAHVQTDIINSNFHTLSMRLQPPSVLKDSRDIAPGLPTDIDTDDGSNDEPPLDFEEIQVYHTQYLDSLLRGCLLESRVLSEAMRSIMRTCERFVGIVERAGKEGVAAAKLRSNVLESEDSDEWLEEVLKLEREFATQTSFFFRTLSGVNPTTPTGPEGSSSSIPPGHLDLLLTRLDYNRWFSLGRLKFQGGRI